MAGLKPMSKSWSASSKINTRSCLTMASRPPFWNRSLSLPGVATRTKGALSRSFLMSDLTLVPPTTHWILETPAP